MSELGLIRAVALSVSVAAAAATPLSVRRLTAGRPPAASTLLGATFAAASGALVVDSLRVDGAAERAGLRVGDRVERIDGRPPAGLADLDRVAVTQHSVDIRVRRGDSDVDVVIAATKRNMSGRSNPADRGRRRDG